ncbi:hypothetical protein GCM10023081_24760 [Arthrobacter ginkgonis]|uniref:YdhG-like domain-containing protein n=1 Tax=Arthrobacter ginkgonis TaxID=1630594 RepID=A0ABP7CBN5_9MICC
MNTVPDYNAALDPPLRDVADRLAELLGDGLPELEATLWHAQPVWMHGKHPVAGYKAFPRYVTLMLWVGPEFHDPAGVLQPAGNQNVVTVKYERTEDIHEDLVGGWLAQLG